MGWVANTLLEPVSLRLFLNNGFKNVRFGDFIPPTFKTAIFGLIIWLSCMFSGDANPGWYGGCWASRHQFGGARLAFHHTRGCRDGSGDSSVVFVRTRWNLKRATCRFWSRGFIKRSAVRRVLNGINLTVPRGQTVAVLGQSGTGKSVLLKLLIRLQQPDAGLIRIHEQAIADLPLDQLSELRKRIGFLFQQAALYDSLTVAENVAFPLERHTSLSPAERRDRARELLSNVGMEQHMAKMPSEISGGMQKRVGLARALALDPDLLLFDEPTAGLDPITAGEIGMLILELKEKRKITSLVVTHDIHGARSFSDQIVVLHGGNILIQGTLEDLQNSRDEFVVRFLSQAA